MSSDHANMKIRGKLIFYIKLSLMALGCSLLASGCITSSAEDDYVAGVLAEAMQEFPPEVVMAGPSNNAGQGVVSAPVHTLVSAPVTTPVSISPSVTPPVFIVPSATPPTTISPPVTPSASISPAVDVSATHPAATIPSVQTTVASAPPVVKQESTPVKAASVPVVAPAVTPVVAPVVSPVVTPSVKPSETAVVQPAVVAAGEKPESIPASIPADVQTPVQRTGTASSGGRQPLPPPATPTIQPDSVLWVSVTEDPSLNGRYMVNDASAIDFGYVGLVFLQDMVVEQAEAELKRVLEGRYLKNATISVKLAKASYDRIGVQGSVEMPGDIKIGPGATITLSEALRRGGGLRGNRENCRVKIVRGGLKTPFGAAAQGDVYSLVTKDGQLKVPEVYLRNDDLAYVFSPSTEVVQGQAVGGEKTAGAGGKRVVLLGEVPRRGVVEFSENEPCTLMYLLFKVGGLPRFAKASKITVVRRNKDGSEQKFLIDGEKLMDNGKPEDDLVLETGDRIVVPARKISFF